MKRSDLRNFLTVTRLLATALLAPILLAVAPPGLGSAWAQGYEIIYQRVDDPGETVTVLVSRHGVVINPGRDGGVYADFAARRIVMLDARNREARDLGRAMAGATAMAVPAAGGQGQGAASDAALQEVQQQMEAMLEGMLADVPEDQRALAEAAMRAQLGLPPAGQGGDTGAMPPLAGGEQMRAAPPEALAGGPRLLYLDEAPAELAAFSDAPAPQGFETPEGRLAGFTPRPARVGDHRLLILAEAAEIGASDWAGEIKADLLNLSNLYQALTGRPLPPEAMPGDFLALTEDEFIYAYRVMEDAPGVWWRLVSVSETALGADMAAPPEGYAVR